MSTALWALTHHYRDQKISLNLNISALICALHKHDLHSAVPIFSLTLVRKLYADYYTSLQILKVVSQLGADILQGFMITRIFFKKFGIGGHHVYFLIIFLVIFKKKTDVVSGKMVFSKLVDLGTLHLLVIYFSFFKCFKKLFLSA